MAPLVCVTANTKGKGSPSTKAAHKPAKVRSDLLLQSLSQCDVGFVQEMSCKKDLCSALKDTHDIRGLKIPGSEAAILLSKDKFVKSSIMFYTGADFMHESDQLNHIYKFQDLMLEPARYMFAVAKEIGSENSILFVSYHGRHQVLKKDIRKKGDKKGDEDACSKRMLCLMFLDLCVDVKVKVGASYIVIGGDFNLSAEVVCDVMLAHLDYDIVFTEPSPRRAGKRVLDFFLHSVSLNVGEVQVHIFDEALREKYDVEDDKELERYLDHDPVMMTVEVAAAAVAAGMPGEE